MPNELRKDIREVLHSHHPNAPATEAELREFERVHGFALDPDLRAFYAAANGARLFRTEDSPYKILPLQQIVSGRTAIFGSRPDGDPNCDDAPKCPDNVFAFCYVQDGNYVGFEVIPGKPYPMLDLFHETWPKYRDVIEDSFGSFLNRALRSEEGLYWLSE